MEILKVPTTKVFSRRKALGSLHILNDGYQASFILLLPFIARGLKLDLTQVGLLGTVLNAASIVLALPAGYIAAKIGGVKTLILALLVYASALFGAGMLGQYYLLIILFAVAGAGFGVFHPIAFALIAKWSGKNVRGRAMGNFTAIGDVGRIGISAALSFVVVYIGWQRAALIYAVLALGLCFVFYRLLIAANDNVHKDSKKPTTLSLWQVLKNRRYVFVMGASGFDGFASASLFVFLPFLLLKRGVSPAFLGTFTAAFFLGNFLGKLLLGRFVDRIGNFKVFILSELLMALFIFLLANSTALYLIVICSLILGAFTKGTLPVLQTMVTDAVEHHGNYEKAFGLNALVSSIAVTAAPILLGLISDKLGIVTAFNIMAVAALCAIVPALGYYYSPPNPIQP